MSGGAEPSGVSMIVVNWNSAGLCIGLLDSLEATLAAGLRAVLVDNGSTDDSVAVLERYIASQGYSESVLIHRLAENEGFTGGVNAGADVALAAANPPDYLWLCNPDMTLTADTLPELLAVARESAAQIITTGGEYLKLNAWPKPFYDWRREGHWAGVPDKRWWPVGAYFGTCVLFEANLVRRLIAHDGHFQDPGLFMDWDEWECTFRARRLGAKIVMSRDAAYQTVTGFRTLGPSARAKVRQYYAARNGIVVGRRNMSAWQFWAVLPVRFARDASWFIRVGLRGARPHPICYIEGTIDGLCGRMGRWRKHPSDAPPSAMFPGPRPMPPQSANR